MREHDNETVVVIGAGLAGLTAAATAARARRPVVVVEAHAEGGRARTDELSGYRFNQGPHALGRGGEASRILRDLGGLPSDTWGFMSLGHNPGAMTTPHPRQGQSVASGTSKGQLADSSPPGT